jgi:hypothetical protein
MDSRLIRVLTLPRRHRVRRRPRVRLRNRVRPDEHSSKPFEQVNSPPLTTFNDPGAAGQKQLVGV